MVSPSLRSNFRKNPAGGMLRQVSPLALAVVGSVGLVSLYLCLRTGVQVEKTLYSGEDSKGLWKRSSWERSSRVVPAALPAPYRSMRSKALMGSSLSVVDSAPQYCGQDSFKAYQENSVKLTSEDPVSTFSVDVDTASYGFVRRMINNDQWPQKDSVRVEEMINYFDYDYPLPDSKEAPFRPTVSVSPSPWRSGQKLVHIGIKGYDVGSDGADAKPRSNLVFLLDVSGSMGQTDRLPLVKKSVEMLLSSLQPEDRVAIATYNHEARVELHPTLVREKGKILKVLRGLRAGGGTGGAGGLDLAYELAESNFDDAKGAVNRVILATDGDFNVGVTDEDRLKKFIESKRETGIFLSVLGYGMGNYKDSRMQTLANHGNGVASYIDTLNEAQKVLVEEASSTLFTIAKDVKIQVEWNPLAVSEYRLVGYEKRVLNREDFNNDNVDAGEIGSGHTVTAIYEITPNDAENARARLIDERRYAAQKTERTLEEGQEKADELGFVKIRYKLPDEDTSKLISVPVARDLEGSAGETVSREFDFATAVAGFAQIIRDGKHIDKEFDINKVLELAQRSKGPDGYGYRSEFIRLVRRASAIPEVKDLYAGTLLSDMSQKDKENIDKPKMPSLEDLLKKLEKELSEEEAAEALLDSLVKDEEDIEDNEE